VSNTKRPTTARKVTTKTEANRAAALDEGVKFQLETDGEWYVLRPADVTPEVAREVRRATGRSFMRLMQEIATDPDIDVLAEGVWAARRIKGEDVDLSEVSVTYQMLLSDGFDIQDAGSSASEVDDSPEA
jgi:hypothetical protein